MRLEEKHIPELMSRFVTFYDAVIYDIKLELWRESGLPFTCRIWITCQDNESESGWSKVQFVIQDVSEFCFRKLANPLIVLSDGIQILFRDEKVYLILDAYQEDEKVVDKRETNNGFVVGASCDWTVELG